MWQNTAMSGISFYGGSLPHFVSHLEPIWLALPEEFRRGFYARGRAAEKARQLGIEVKTGLPRREPLVCCASFEDYRAVNPAKVVLVNHGSGQTYRADPASAEHPSYSGGRGRERVVLHLSPSERDAEICRRGGGTAVAVGSPRLDRFHSGQRVKRLGQGERPTVAVSFHADIHACPESRSAFSHYRQAFIDLAHTPNLPFTLLGHAHPRWTLYIRKFWERIGVEFVEDFADVLERADCYVIDNSSTGPEFASTGRPIVWLSAPWYRRSVHHGGRFWDWTKGIPHAEKPSELLPVIGLALADIPPIQAARQRMVTAVYDDLCDGHSTERAVAAILQLLDRRDN